MSLEKLPNSELKTNGSTPIAPEKRSAKAPEIEVHEARSVDDFLKIAERILGRKHASPDLEILRSSDVDLGSSAYWVVVRIKGPDGLEVVVGRRKRRWSVKWKRLWPYVLLTVVVAAGLMVAWKGDAIIALILKLFD